MHLPKPAIQSLASTVASVPMERPFTAEDVCPSLNAPAQTLWTAKSTNQGKSSLEIAKNVFAGRERIERDIKGDFICLKVFTEIRNHYLEI